MTERPETITLAGVELRWSEERKGWESAEPGARPRAVAWYNRWEDFWRATVRVASVRFEIEAETLPSLDAAARAALTETRDACAAIVGPGVDVEAIRAEERERCAANARTLAAMARKLVALVDGLLSGDPELIRAEAADVCNFAMIVAEVAGARPMCPVNGCPGHGCEHVPPSRAVRT